MSEQIPTTGTAANEGVAAAQKKVAEARAAKQAEQKAAREARQSEIIKLKSAVGSKFDGGEIVDFQADKLLGQRVGDAYLINLGNPHRHDFVFCDDFSNKYKLNQ